MEGGLGPDVMALSIPQTGKAQMKRSNERPAEMVSDPTHREGWLRENRLRLTARHRQQGHAYVVHLP